MTNSNSEGMPSSDTPMTLIPAPPPEPSPCGLPVCSLTRGYRRPSAVILCGSARAGQRILRSIRRYLAEQLKLIVNEVKSQVVPLVEASFLGFQIVRRKVRWTKKSQKKFKAKVKEITKRTRGHSPGSVIAELSVYLRGAFNYYQLGISFGEARELDTWVRSRVRLYYWNNGGRCAADGRERDDANC